MTEEEEAAIKLKEQGVVRAAIKASLHRIASALAAIHAMATAAPASFQPLLPLIMNAAMPLLRSPVSTWEATAAMSRILATGQRLLKAHNYELARCLQAVAQDAQGGTALALLPTPLQAVLEPIFKLQARVPFPVLSAFAFSVVFPLLESILSAEQRSSLPLVGALNMVSAVTTLPTKFDKHLAPGTALFPSQAALDAATFTAVCAASAAKGTGGNAAALSGSAGLLAWRTLRARIATALLRALPTAGRDRNACSRALCALYADAARQWRVAAAAGGDAPAPLVTPEELQPLLGDDGLLCSEDSVRAACVAALTSLLSGGDDGDDQGAAGGAGAGAGAGGGAGAGAGAARTRFSHVPEAAQPGLSSRLWHAAHDEEESTADAADALWSACGVELLETHAGSLFDQLSHFAASVRHSAGRAIAAAIARFPESSHTAFASLQATFEAQLADGKDDSDVTPPSGMIMGKGKGAVSAKMLVLRNEDEEVDEDAWIPREGVLYTLQAAAEAQAFPTRALPQVLAFLVRLGLADELPEVRLAALNAANAFADSYVVGGCGCGCVAVAAAVAAAVAVAVWLCGCGCGCVSGCVCGFVVAVLRC